MPAGRPSDYTPELAGLICRRIALGESVRAIGRDPDMPNPDTIWTWLLIHEEFSEQYARAKSHQMDLYGEQIVEIADDSSDDVRVLPDGREIVNHDNIQRAKLRVDTRKWLMEKLRAKKYGNKADLNVTGTGLTVNIHKGTTQRGD